MVETEGFVLFRRHLLPVGAGCFKQIECADDIGLDKLACRTDRAVDMAFRRQVHHGIGPVLCEYAVEFGAVANVHLLESIAGIIGNVGQRFEIARVGQFVEVDDGILGVLNDMADNGRADKARAAGNEDGFFVCGLHLIPISVGVAADPTPRILHHLRKAAFGFPTCLLFGMGRVGKGTRQVSGASGLDLIGNI
ncbi:Uncharacterised protein [Neisseria meningitidis]|nr:Uncharacterised protein [Neisseria meningitidis]